LKGRFQNEASALVPLGIFQDDTKGKDMKTLSLGMEGPQVSAICLGSAYFGTRISPEVSFEILDTYYEQGGRFIDTANSYAGWVAGAEGGESERTIGDWMRSRGVRQEMFIATKVGIGYPGVEEGLAPERVAAECDKSLSRLGIEQIDLYYAHIDDRQTPLAETLGAFGRLADAGKVRLIGASNFRAWRMEQAYGICQAEGLPYFQALEMHHTYLKPWPEADWTPGVVATDAHFDFAAARGVRILAYYALLKGAYVRTDRPFWTPYQTEANQKRMARLKHVAEDIGATLNQTVLAWMLHRNPAVLPITTASHREHLLENLGALTVTIEPEQVDYLNFTDLDTK
jgi:aryl-alcohol dehydrogenase-like predicted oxidoreductase